MRHRSFGEFVDKKKRDAVRQLRLVKQMLESHGLKVENFLDGDDDTEPYIFCFNPAKTGGFEGIRIYKIGDELAFRIQKESKTHPYGAAYPLPVEEMFSDFLTDKDTDELKAGKRVIESVSKEVRRFFERSLEAEREDRERADNRKGKGDMLIRTTGTDYSSLVYQKT